MIENSVDRPKTKYYSYSDEDILKAAISQYKERDASYIEPIKDLSLLKKAETILLRHSELSSSYDSSILDRIKLEVASLEKKRQQSIVGLVGSLIKNRIIIPEDITLDGYIDIENLIDKGHLKKNPAALSALSSYKLSKRSKLRQSLDSLKSVLVDRHRELDFAHVTDIDILNDRGSQRLKAIFSK